MSPGIISFIVWSAAMLCILGAFIWTARHSKGVQQETEDMASACLPEIGKIAKKKHTQRFGRAPTDAPGEDSAWYPDTKKKVVKASG
jgi:hypothetical protein